MTVPSLTLLQPGALRALPAALADFINPAPQQPPGTAGLVTLMGWVAWGFTGVCVIALIVAAGSLALAHRSGRGGDHAQGMVVVLVAAIIGSSAGPLLNALT